MMNNYQLAEHEARQALAEERKSLALMEAGIFPDFLSEESSRKATMEECHLRINAINQKLADPNKLMDWWNSIPQEIKESWSQT